MLRPLTERAVEKRRNLCMCFIDYEKSFDQVRQTDLMDMLEMIGIGYEECSLIRNLYWEQKASVRIDGDETDYQPIKRGVRQGCVLSLDLFSP